MSIKKLFDSANKNKNYSDYANEKEKFEFVESSRNAKEIHTKNKTFVPHLNYDSADKFIRYSSAYLFYEGAITRITDYYPYDGSDAEKNKFYNSLQEGEKHIFDNLWPTTTGYALFSADGWGNLNGSKTSDEYGLPSSLEYITFKGGPVTSSGNTLVDKGNNPNDDKFHFSNIYDENIYQSAGLPDDFGKGTRLSNLRSNFDDGVTVEFWLKKDSFTTASTCKEIVLDVWNNNVSSSADYGRLTIELTGAETGSPFLITAHSGNISGAVGSSSIGENITTSSLTSWGHYAFSFYNTGSNFIAKFYHNGVLNDTNKYSGNINELNSKGMMGRLGALLTAPSASAIGGVLPAAYEGAGKLSASLDDFRFWKVARNSQEISMNWFGNVNGGSNTDISNTTLGIYYKFNEGITGDSGVDSVVLDYAGRISNGIWTGYDAGSRNTGSAIVSASASIFEYEDHIIRTTHPSYIELSSSLILSGGNYDLNNNSSFINYIPSWVIEEHENQQNQNLKIMCHIMGTYFDKLYFLTQEVPKVRQAHYITSSTDALPFARHLPQSLGMYMPDTFIDSTVLESLLNKNEVENFKGNVEDTKNLIYTNIYNNLTSIFKSKGTDRAVKNVFRCFNLDDSLIQFKQYASNTTYELENNLIQKKIFKKFLNLNNKHNTQGVVYQAINSDNSDSSGYISGSVGSADDGIEIPHGVTIEAQVQFPFYFKNFGDALSRNDKKMSLFGMHSTHTSSTNSLNGTDTTFVSSSNDYSNFQVFAIRESENSKNIYFQLTSSRSPYPLPELTSSIFFHTYNNTNWNISVRLKPSNYPFSGIVSGAESYNYDVIFKGSNVEAGVVVNSFELTGSIPLTSGSNFIKYPKRVYAGARRTNITGALLQSSDVLLGNVKYWTKYLDDDSLLQHSNDIFNSGISGSYKNISPLQLSGTALDLINLNTLALNWNFQQLTGSDSDGKFVVQDFSSGSSLIRDNYGWLGSISGYQHTGYGYGFATSSSDVIDKRFINVNEFVDPEQVVSSEMINILSEDDTVFKVARTVPSYLFSLEKSMYASISSEMLKFFAGIIDFNNIIGAPVNRYRERYKDLEKLREIFFRRVTKTSDVEKFVNYYKWFDDAISSIVAQLIPASADYIEDVMNIIEPHTLERDKYQTKFPTLEFSLPTIEGSMKSIVEKLYPWSLGHSTIPASARDDTKHLRYWKDRAERNATETTSGDSTIDRQRDTIRQVVITDPFLSSALPILKTVDGTNYHPSAYSRRKLQKLYKKDVIISKTIRGGVNFEPSKNIHFTYNALAPAGPVSQDSTMFVPKNVLLALMTDLAKVPVNNDPKLAYQKIKRHVKVLHGRDHEDGFGYSNVKSNIAFPFNIIESNVSGGYQVDLTNNITGNHLAGQIKGLTITNLHNDVYGPDMEKPMQGPFTEYAVGGHQSRHVAINKGSDDYTNRPEAWKLLLGTCVDSATTIEDSGAIGMVSADYPWPEANEIGATPYPMTASQKAVFYRGFVAKRPVNIRNIKHTTGSTVLGNYNNNYDVVNSFGAYSNPRNFIEQQPTLPTQALQNNATGSTSVRTFLDIRRDDNSHFKFFNEYSVAYLTPGLLSGALSGSTTKNRNIISTRFSAPGGIEINSYGYRDVRGSEFSVYNNINYRNLSVRKPFQPPSGSSGSFDQAPTGSGLTSIKVSDIHGKDFGLSSHLSRHSAQFGRDSLVQSGTNFRAGTSYIENPSFHKTNRNRIDRRKFKRSGSVGPDVPIHHHSLTELGSHYDNFFVTQQIPKSTLSYSWISASYKTLNDKFGIVSPSFRVLGANSKIVNSIEFVSASEAASFYGTSGRRTFGNDARYNLTNPIHASFNSLNTNVVSQHNTSSATIGTSTNALDYLNTDLIDDANLYGTASILNSLILNRQGPYGYPSWIATRNQENKLLKNYRNNNRLYFLSSTGSHLSHADFEMPPVSLRGRTLVMGFTDSSSLAPSTEFDAPVITLGPQRPNIFYAHRADFSNNYIYFNLDKFEDQFNLNYFDKTTAGEQLLQIVNQPQFTLKYLVYTENIFPSQRNEFLSHSRNKVSYDNLYWRNSNSDRVTLGTTFTNTQNIHVTQSSWILDAPSDFLTRNGVPTATLLSSAAFPASSSAQLLHLRNTLRQSASAGELQNTYSTYFSSNRPAGTNAENWEKGAVLTPAALYARKQTITSPRSVASPSGMQWHLTKSNTGPFDSSKQIDLFAGEATWEAGQKAGIIDSSLSGTLGSFVSMSSKPWFNSYEDYNYLIKKISTAKEFACVPEYRSSEHAEHYLNFGRLDENKHDSFEIPHTDMSSSHDNFYIDYSNSEFLKEYMNLDSLVMAGLKGQEIRLSCTGTIRYNPYKSFYPAQRTADLVERFYKSYSGVASSPTNSGSWGDFSYMQGVSGSMIKALYQPLFAPGILYNSIKSGLAVDYPIITDASKVIRTQFGDSAGAKRDNWALVANTASFQSNEDFWDKRLDFETMIFPEDHINDVKFFDMDSHPSCSIHPINYTFRGGGDVLYPAMASNFFAEVANFYLGNSTFTTLRSQPKTEVLVSQGDVFMARVKLRRSMTGSKSYENEYGSDNIGFSNTPYGDLGGRRLITASGGETYDFSTARGNSFPIPQDPMRRTGSLEGGIIEYEPYRETFTMYSRPSAFGSPIAGRSIYNTGTVTPYLSETICDSFNGFNPAYTPPYYNGEAWCDIIFRPTGSTTVQSYTVEEIMQQSKYVYWRFDAGFRSSSVTTAGLTREFRTTLIHDDSIDGIQGAIYGGPFINSNSMQISASINLFGIEDVPETLLVPQTGRTQITNIATAKRWVIAPKFETPMLNFNDRSSVRRLTQDQVSVPQNFGEESVPRGMWHQFGIIEPDATKGIFLEIGDVPTSWLKNHYDVMNNDSVYNNFDVANSGSATNKSAKSLVKLLGFDRSSTSKKLGQLKDQATVYEAVVAVPYVLESFPGPGGRGTSQTFSATERKKFVSIPEERYQAALTSSIGTTTGDSLEAAGYSIRRQVDLMNKYIFPPELDFVNNNDLEPIAMYIFEFEYKFDKDDLSYIWQNIAPRNYDKISLQNQTVSHELIDTELLSETNLSENENLRWMIFKVKQRSQKLYSQLKLNTVGDYLEEYSLETRLELEPFYNWPYDYLSFVEKIKIDAQILFKESDIVATSELAPGPTRGPTAPGYSATAPGGAGTGGPTPPQNTIIPLTDPSTISVRAPSSGTPPPRSPITTTPGGAPADPDTQRPGTTSARRTTTQQPRSIRTGPFTPDEGY
jgi:hypothetical protein